MDVISMVKKYTELSKDEEQRALELHNKAVVINALSLFQASGGATDLSNFQEYCNTMKRGGVSAVNLTLGGENMGAACLTITNMYNLIHYTDDAMLIRTVDDILTAKKLGKAGIIFGFQNTENLETNISLSWNYKCWGPLELYYNLGVRIIQLTYSRRSRLGDGCFERTDSGLSWSGIDVIEGMNKLGMLIDLSHCGPKTTLEAIDVSKDPVAFTHSGARGINNIPRLKGDEEIKAMAEKGGVMGIIAESMFIRHPSATLEDLLDHIDYVRDIVGADHIGIGGDIPEVRGPGTLSVYDSLRRMAEKRWKEDPNPLRHPDWWYLMNQRPESMWVEGFDTMAKTLNVTRGLVARGYSDDEILGILGGNFLRLFKKVWRK
jgi:membrane dipeptidase